MSQSGVKVPSSKSFLIFPAIYKYTVFCDTNLSTVEKSRSTTVKSKGRNQYFPPNHKHATMSCYS